MDLGRIHSFLRLQPNIDIFLEHSVSDAALQCLFYFENPLVEGHVCVVHYGFELFAFGLWSDLIELLDLHARTTVSWLIEDFKTFTENYALGIFRQLIFLYIKIELFFFQIKFELQAIILFLIHLKIKNWVFIVVDLLGFS